MDLPRTVSPLFVTADPALLDGLQPLAAGAGVAAGVARDVASALHGWSAAALVLVGPDLLGELAAVGPARRDGVHVVTLGDAWASDGLFRDAVTVGATSVVELPLAAGWLADELADVSDPLAGRGVVIGVFGGSGGAGATTLACALGQAAGRAGPALVVDADACGPGVDRVLGLDDLEGIRWSDLQASAGRLSSSSLRDAVPRRGGVGALTWSAGDAGSLQAPAVREAIAAGQRGHRVVVVDLPRLPTAWTDEVVSRCDLVLVVVRPSLAGVASAARLVSAQPGGVRAGLVLRRVARAIPATEVSAAMGLPVLAEMADQRGVDESVELGLGPLRSSRGPLFRAAAELLAEALDPGLAA
ncbi:septum site-determining protein Ssd [Nocardioides sp. InS609-2]|uniref:septum site-determining protein Ssd n=1 Tax=Nocardioides sp. InS609-2 TaxID=2760705 RepID=UPI0020C0DD1B|nr:septum site-determining protein Ssd [Nocardioides sp. InS609-2]